MGGPGGPNNLVALLQERARATTTVAARVKVGGAWQDVSWAQVFDRVRALSQALTAWGLKPGDRAAIFANTSLDWVVVDLAIAASRGISVPIYASNTPDEVRYVLQNSGASLLFIDDDVADGRQAGRLTRAKEKLGECTDCSKVVLFAGAPEGERFETMAAFLARGQGTQGFEERVAGIQEDELCHYLYTSGTTGDPKGVMLTHGNWAFEGWAIAEANIMRPDDSVMLFLPLAHSFAQAAKAAWLGAGFTMVFAESVDKLIANLTETRPTMLPAVPRVFEKVFNGVQANAVGAPGLKGALARWAFRLFDEYVAAREAGQVYDSLGWSMAKALVFKKVQAAVKERLGGRMRLFVSGGAPLPRKVGYFFDLLGFDVCEGYGLSETSAGATINLPGRIRIGTVGPAFPKVKVKVAEDGELLVQGPNVMKGYYKNEAATAEVLEPDGWFHTGDIGEIDQDGAVRITDRKKDLIKTSGGKYCAPQNLEGALKGTPLVSNAMVHGDLRPYLVVLLCVSEEAARKLLGAEAPASYADLAKHPRVYEALKQVVEDLNGTLPPYSSLKRFAVMDHDFTQETGELTPTLKVKRKFCSKKYAAELDGLYSEAAA